MDKHKIQILAVGENLWYETLEQTKEQYSILKDIEMQIEFITSIEEANLRLMHNSYDILVIEELYVETHSIELSKMAYAMSRPTLIVCSNKFKVLLYNMWKKFNNWSNRFLISKKMIFFESSITCAFDRISDCEFIDWSHEQINGITEEINEKVSL